MTGAVPDPIALDVNEFDADAMRADYLAHCYRVPRPWLAAVGAGYLVIALLGWTRHTQYWYWVLYYKDAMDLFGSQTRTRILLYLSLAEESYVAEMVMALGYPKLTIQRITRDLEDLGVVASRLRGRVRLVSLDKTWFAASELRALLQRLSAADAGILDAAASVRRRPRRPGKSL